MRYIKINQINSEPIQTHSDYSAACEWVFQANQNKSPQSLQYDTIISVFPETTWSWPEKPVVMNIEKNILGMLFLSVKVKNKYYKFLLDTGAMVTCVAESLATNDLLFNAEAQLEVGDAGGFLSHMGVGCLHQLEINTLKIESLPVLILKETQLNMSLLGVNVFKIDGIIGWDILKHLDFEITLNKQLFYFERHITSETHNFIPSDFPVVLVEDEHHNLLKFGLDTGAKKSWISSHLIETTGLKQSRTFDKKILGFNGPMIQSVSEVKRFKIKILSTEVMFSQIQTGFTGFLNDFELDGIIGQDLLKKRKLSIKNSQGTLEFIKPINKFK